MNSPNTTRILLSAPQPTGQEATWLATDPLEWPRLVSQFEQGLCQITGTASALATHSGTTALELALRTLGTKPGDSVICPALTFVATANAIRNVRATPLFIGSESASWGLDPDALETVLKRLVIRPKAIIAVDLFGMPAQWPALQTLADRYGISLIADAAESLGSTLDGKACGTWAKLNALSFNQNKIITAGGGGALLTNNEWLRQTACVFANQGRHTEWPHELVLAGGNYRMSPLVAAYGLAQLAHLTERVTRRRAICETYQTALQDLPGVRFQPERAGAVSNRWLTAITINAAEAGISRDELAEVLNGANIETRPIFPLLHQQQAYRSCGYVGDTLAEQLAQTGLCLPSGASLTDAQIERIVDVIRRAFRAG